MDNNIAISLKNVSKTFKIFENSKYSLRALVVSFFNQGKTKEFKALDNINLEIKKGEFVGIIGKNGSGKSTLLKLIAGIYNVDRGGVIKVNGRLVPFLELGVGFNPELSGKENIYLNGTILGMTKSFLDKKYEEIVEFSELSEFMDMAVKNYSSGMVVRLAFAIAIQTDAEIYILDEILSVGDAGFQRKSLQTIRNMKKKGKTILFVSHSIASIKELCDRAVLINEHKIQSIGETQKVAFEYEQLFLNDQTNPVKVKEQSEETNSIKFSSGGTKARILSYQFFNNKNEPTLQFESNKEITIKVQIILNQEFKYPLMIGIMFKDDIQHQLLGLHSKLNSLPLDIPAKVNIPIDISCKTVLSLNQGSYYVTFTLTELFDKPPYYEFEDIHQLINYETIGVYNIKPTWGMVYNDSKFTIS